MSTSEVQRCQMCGQRITLSWDSEGTHSVAGAEREVVIQELERMASVKYGRGELIEAQGLWLATKELRERDEVDQT